MRQQSLPALPKAQNQEPDCQPEFFALQQRDEVSKAPSLSNDPASALSRRKELSLGDPIDQERLKRCSHAILSWPE
jgi:hypothetical protein